MKSKSRLSKKYRIEAFAYTAYIYAMKAILLCLYGLTLPFACVAKVCEFIIGFILLPEHWLDDECWRPWYFSMKRRYKDELEAERKRLDEEERRREAERIAENERKDEIAEREKAEAAR